MKPAEELRAAAAKLREMAGEAKPWSVITTDRESLVLTDREGCSRREVADCDRASDAAWIALMGPDKADVLAAWLDDEARDAGQLEGFVTFSDNWPALLFARSILGESR